MVRGYAPALVALRQANGVATLVGLLAQPEPRLQRCVGCCSAGRLGLLVCRWWGHAGLCMCAALAGLVAARQPRPGAAQHPHACRALLRVQPCGAALELCHQPRLLPYTVRGLAPVASPPCRKCLQVLQYMLRVMPLDRQPACADTNLLPALRWGLWRAMEGRAFREGCGVGGVVEARRLPGGVRRHQPAARARVGQVGLHV